MIKVWLDDLRSPPDATWVVAKTVPEAKALFINNEIEDASFDNDLAGSCVHGCWEEQTEGKNTMVVRVCSKDCKDECHETGSQLVDWIEATGAWPRKKPTVHSDNGPAIARMRSVIDKHYG